MFFRFWVLFGVVGLASLMGCFKVGQPPRPWLEHVKTARKSYQEKLGVPAVKQLFFVSKKEGGFYLIEKKGKKFELSLEPSGEVSAHFLVDFEKLKVIHKGSKKTHNLKEELFLGSGFYLTFTKVDEKTVRIFSYDLEAPGLEENRKRHFFKYNSRYKLTAKYRWLPKAESINFQRSDGTSREYSKVGVLELKSLGRLSVYVHGDLESVGNKTMLMFRDETNGVETYGAGRYLVVEFKSDLKDVKEGEEVEVDFNFATHPLCEKSKAFRCPLAQDHINFHIRAGERF